MSDSEHLRRTPDMIERLGSYLPMLEREATIRYAPGDSPDWGQLIKRFDRHVWLRLLALRVPIEQARDLKQEVWTTLLAKWRTGELAYLEMPGLALSHVELVVKRARRPRSSASAENVIELADELSRALCQDAERSLCDRERLAAVRRALESRSPSALRVFELTYTPPGMKAREVSRELCISEQRVRQILTELRAHLRSQSC